VAIIQRIRAYTRKQDLSSLRPVFLVLGVLIIGLYVSGYSPTHAAKVFVQGVFGSRTGISDSLLKLGTLLTAGLGTAIAFKTGLTSLGAEGQILVGGLFAAVVAVNLPNLPTILVIVLSAAAAFLAGALWGAVPGLLKAKLGVSEVINTIMLNYVGIYVVNFAISGPFKDPAPGGFPQSPPIPKNAWLPIIWPGTRLHIGLIIGLFLVFAYYIIIWRLPLGFRMRATGANPDAARYAGIKTERATVLSMALSGGICGMAGMLEVLGLHHRVIGSFSSGYGYDAVAVSLLGRLAPLGILASGSFFSVLRVGVNSIQRVMQVPTALVYVVQGLVILIVLIDELRQHQPAHLLTAQKRGVAQ
jgi:ABC-type uncharacterized transport system permease subunit